MWLPHFRSVRICAIFSSHNLINCACARFLFDAEKGRRIGYRRLTHPAYVLTWVDLNTHIYQPTSGSVAFANSNDFFILHGLQTGFHMHMAKTPENAPGALFHPLRSFDNKSSRCNRWLQCALINDRLLVAGTDHGKLYIFEVGSGECLYSLEPKDPCS